MNRIAKLFQNSFSIDLKMLGVFRFLIGMVVIWDLWGRFQIRHLIFGDGQTTAIVPTELSADGHSIWHFSLFWTDRFFRSLSESLASLFGAESSLVTLANAAEGFFLSPQWIDLIFYIGLASALLYCLGFFSRFSAFALWLVLLSVQHCMPMMNTGGDSLLKMFAFWSIFLPIGCHFSLDSFLFSRNGYWRKRTGQVQMRIQTWCRERGLKIPRLSHNLCTAATAAIMLQLVSVYFFSGLEKCNENWFSGKALGIALSCPNYVKPLGVWLSSLTTLTGLMTWTVLFVELALPILVFAPGLFRYTRRPTILFLWLMHLGIALTMSIGTFWLVSAIAWLLFLPSSFGSYSRTNWILRLLGLQGKPNQKILQADQDFLNSQEQSTEKRRFMSDAVVVEFDHQEDLQSDISSGSIQLDPGAGRWSTAADFAAGSIIIAILWWQLSHAPASVVGGTINGSFPKPISPAIYHLSLQDRYPLFAHPPEGKVTYHYDIQTLPDSTLGPKIPENPSGIMETHPQFLWRQYHFNLSYRSTYSSEFIKKLKLRFRLWAKSHNKKNIPNNQK